MTEDSAVLIFGKVVLGGAVGFVLFLVGTGLGRGGGGRGGGGRGGGTSPVPPVALPPAPLRPRDDKRLSFVMIEPRVVGGAMGFRLRDGEPSKIYALDELIERVRDGGRSDVELRASGNVIQGPWDEAQKRLKSAGLTVWLAETSPGLPVRAGFAVRDNTRGQYR